METSSIFASRKFYIMLVDVAVSLVTYFAGKYANPESAKDILFLIGALQPVVLMVVGSITVQNVAGIKAAADVAQSAHYAATVTAEDTAVAVK